MLFSVSSRQSFDWFLSALGGIVYMCRLDYSPLGRKLETWDSGYSSYCGFIHTECTHRHPILLVFAGHLLDLSKKKHKSISTISILNNFETQSLSKKRRNSTTILSCPSKMADDCLSRPESIDCLLSQSLFQSVSYGRTSSFSEVHQPCFSKLTRSKICFFRKKRNAFFSMSSVRRHFWTLSHI